MIRNLIKKIFDIRDGEIRISFFMQIYIFLLISVLLMVKPTVNALFLSKLGSAHLPYGYILVAVVAVITSFFYNLAVKKFSLKSITIITLVFFSISFFVLSYIMHVSLWTKWILYAYYLGIAIFAVLVTSQFWIIANMVFNAREAKRLFGFIGAGAIAGGIFGGYLTTILATSFGNRIVIIAAAGLILCCIPILNLVWKLRVTKLNGYIRNQRLTKKKESYNSPLKIIIESKHLSYLALIVGVGVVIAKLVDFQFSDFASKTIPDSDELASFFGFWFSTFNVLALMIQLFLTNRLLAWLGITSNLLILPLGIAIGCLLFLTFPELWVLIIIKGMDGSFKQSINKAGIELSILPIPYHIKNEAKSYIDVVVDSLATGLSGLLLIFVIRKLELSTSYVTIIVLFLLFIWMILIYKLREAYFQSFRTNIQNSLTANSVVTRKLGDRKNRNSSIEILNKGSEAEILSLLDRLKDFRLKKLEPHIIHLLSHPSSKVKTAAIEQLHYYKMGTALSTIKSLILVKDDNVVYAALNYLLHHTYIQDSRIFDAYLNHESDYISNAALLCLAKDSEGNQKLAEKYKIKDRISDWIASVSEEDDTLRPEELAELLIAIAYSKESDFYYFIAENFTHPNPYIVEHAIKAAGTTAHEPFVETLLEFLAESQYRKKARKALRNYGEGITKTILELDLSENLKESVKRYVPKVIESFKSRASIKQLTRLLKSRDFVIRLEAAESLSKLRARGAPINIDQRSLTRIIFREATYYRNSLSAIDVVEKTLRESEMEDFEVITEEKSELRSAREELLALLAIQLEQSLSSMFKLLSLKYDPADMSTAYSGLKSDLTDTKFNTIEFLDNLLHSKLKSALLPLIEYHVIEPDGTQVTVNDLKSLTESQALKLLMKNRGGKMKKVVIAVVEATKDVQYIELLNTLSTHKNIEIRTMADRVKQSLVK